METLLNQIVVTLGTPPTPPYIDITYGDIVIFALVALWSLVAGYGVVHDGNERKEAQRMAELHAIRMEKYRRAAAERPAPISTYRAANAPVCLTSRRRYPRHSAAATRRWAK